MLTIRSSVSGAEHRPLVAVIDRNAHRREEMAAALGTTYRVEAFYDIEAAAALLRTAPSVLLVDENAADGHPGGLVKALRQSTLLREVPIIVCGVANRDATGDDPPNCRLGRPFRRSQLLHAVSQAVSRRVEVEWRKLSERPQAALRNTLHAFNSISSRMERGEPLDWQSMDEVSGALVSAITHAEFRDILHSVRGHDNYTYVHSLRVATLLTLFGQAMGLSTGILQFLASGGLVHDIGKMAIPLAVLNKPGRLSGDEMAIMRSHVVLSEKYLRRCQAVPEPIFVVASQHHERPDGSGYPRGLAASKLNELARMAALADVFTALTDDRCYKPSMTAEAALALMVGDMAPHLDQPLLRRFRETILDAGVGRER